jgi:hypothetical protein
MRAVGKHEHGNGGFDESYERVGLNPSCWLGGQSLAPNLQPSFLAWCYFLHCGGVPIRWSLFLAWRIERTSRLKIKIL